MMKVKLDQKVLLDSDLGYISRFFIAWFFLTYGCKNKP